MIRLTFYISMAIILALGAVWLADHPGNLQLNWQDWEIRMSVAVYGLLMFLYSLGLWFLFKLYRWFKTDNPLMGAKRQQSRLKRGLDELDLGWSAMAVNNNIAAIKHGKKAMALLPADNGPLRLLLDATTEKDHQKYLNLLNEKPAIRLVALRSRLEEELSSQQNKAALGTLKEMQQLKPDNQWITRKMFDLLTRLGKWDDAHGALKKLIKTKALDPVEQKHLLCVLYYSQAVEADLANQKTLARDLAGQALKNDPAFIPAARLLARNYMAHDEKGKARKLLENTWKLMPHPDLAKLYLELEPMESQSEKFRRMQKFASLNSDNVTSLNLLANIALDTEQWAEAKKALNRLLTSNRANRTSFLLLARLEMLQKQDKKAADDFLARAGQAPADPAWQCQSCHITLEKFTPVCPSCHDFAQVKWQE